MPVGFGAQSGQVRHDHEEDMLGVDPGFMGHPLVGRLHIQRAVPGAVGADEPHALRRVSASFVAIDDLARDPGIGLNVPHPERHIDDLRDLPGLQIDGPQAALLIPRLTPE